jgi:hypothetical protein
MSKWDGNKLVADEPKAKEKSILDLLKEISNKLDAIIENTTPEGADS